MKHLKKFNESLSEWKKGHLVKDYDDKWYVIDDDENILVNSEQQNIFHMDDINFDDEPCEYKLENGKAFVRLKETKSPRLY